MSARFTFLGLSLALISLPASAESVANTRRYETTPVLSPYLTLDGAHTLGDGAVALSAMTALERRPLVFLDPKAGVTDVILERWSTDLALALGLLPRVDFGVSVPVIVNQTGRTLTLDGLLPTTAVADPSIALKVELVDKLRMPVGIALVGHASLPFGDEAALVGERESTWGGRLVLELPRGSRFDAALNLGYRARPKAQLEELPLDDELSAGLGISWRLWPRFALTGELSVAAAVDAPFKYQEQTPADAGAGARLRVWNDLHVVGGGGVGLVGGYGAPAWRALFGLEWTPQRHDWDADRVADGEDNCLEVPGDEANAGCVGGPTQVAQPTPPPAPARPRASDADEDLVADAIDQCPFLPEDQDRFRDEDGCPDPDDDLDLVADNRDGDPRSPEDWDDFDDDDGIPDVDDDRDGVADLEDTCPREAGDGDDGCPGGPKRGGDLAGRRTRVGGSPDGPVVLGDTVYPPSPVLFEFATTTFTPDSVALVAGLAEFLAAHPELGAVEVGVHVDAIGARPWKMWLSQARADAVKAALVAAGVPDERLTARGYGPDVPVADNREPLGRWLNRRVELRLVERGVADATAKRPPIRRVPSPEGERGPVLRPEEPILFENKSAVLKPGSPAQLDALARQIRENPQWPSVEIAVYTDGRGDLRAKERLSEARAEAVKRVLVTQGVPAKRLTTRGFGGYVPIADDGTPEGRARNRRVELTVVKRPKAPKRAKVAAHGGAHAAPAKAHAATAHHDEHGGH
jgi:outer membrane protein OmpA-like peptidoglycan-associated protein